MQYVAQVFETTQRKRDRERLSLCVMLGNLVYIFSGIFSIYFIFSISFLFRFEHRSTMRIFSLLFNTWTLDPNANANTAEYKCWLRSSAISLIMYSHWNACSSQHINHILFNWTQLSACRKRRDVWMEVQEKEKERQSWILNVPG